jgi:DtxR family Mn-dependent transcriptional regulator
MTSISSRGIPLASLRPGTRGRIARVARDLTGRAERLAVLGVTPGATVRVLQTFPGIVFECDQTEMAVEREVARAILVDVE